jgi:hypothetical protein
LEEASSIVQNATFGSAGTADTCCRLFLNIQRSARCVVKNLVIEGFAGALEDRFKGERKSEDYGIIIHSIQSPLSLISPLPII